MARDRGKKKDGCPSILRCDTLPTFMNPGKLRLLQVMHESWRDTACEFGRIQWRCFFEKGRFDPLFDPAKVYRKRTVIARAGILQQIVGRYGLSAPEPSPEAEDAKKKGGRRAAMAPGLIDMLSSHKAALGAAQVQMVMSQVMGTLDSYVSNRKNDFAEVVFNSSLAQDDAVRHMLLTVNRAGAWFDLKRSVK